MGTLTLKQCLDDALVQVNFLPENPYVGNTDNDIRLLVRMANKLCNELLNEEWPSLIRTGTIDGASPDSGETLQWTLASDFHHFVNDTTWAASGLRDVILPENPARWGRRATRTAQGTLQYAFRLFGNVLYAVDVAPSGVVRYEYVSKRLILKAGEDGAQAADFVTRFQNDLDVFQLDSELLIQGVAAYFAQAKRLENWQELFSEFKRYKRTAKSNATGARTFNAGEDEALGFQYGEPIAEQEFLG